MRVVREGYPARYISAIDNRRWLVNQGLSVAIVSVLGALRCDLGTANRSVARAEPDPHLPMAPFRDCHKLVCMAGVRDRQLSRTCPAPSLGDAVGAVGPSPSGHQDLKTVGVSINSETSDRSPAASGRTGSRHVHVPRAASLVPHHDDPVDDQWATTQ